MTVARSAAEVLDEHVTFELECIDRMYLNAYVPSGIAYGQSVAATVGGSQRHLTGLRVGLLVGPRLGLGLTLARANDPTVLAGHGTSAAANCHTDATTTLGLCSQTCCDTVRTAD